MGAFISWGTFWQSVYNTTLALHLIKPYSTMDPKAEPKGTPLITHNTLDPNGRHPNPAPHNLPTAFTTGAITILCPDKVSLQPGILYQSNRRRTRPKPTNHTQKKTSTSRPNTPQHPTDTNRCLPPHSLPPQQFQVLFTLVY